MSNRDGRDELEDRRLALAAVGLTVAGVILAFWIAITWGALNLRERERAYPVPETECANDTKCAQQALKVQAREAAVAEASVEIAVFQFALSAAGIVLIGLTAFYAHRAWLEARTSANEAVEANRISRETFAASHRPWVAIRSIELTGPLIVANGMAQVSLQFALENTGTTPAQGVLVHPRCTLKPSVTEGVRLQAKFADGSRRDRYAYGETIFPGEKVPTYRSEVFNPDEMNHVPAEDGVQRILVFVYGFIGYRSFLDSDEMHQTRFAFAIGPTKDGPLEFVVHNGRLQVEAKDMRILRWATGWKAD